MRPQFGWRCFFCEGTPFILPITNMIKNAKCLDAAAAAAAAAAAGGGGGEGGRVLVSNVVADRRRHRIAFQIEASPSPLLPPS